MKPILQQSVWADFQRQLGKKVHEGTGQEWSFVAVQERTPLGMYLYVPYGPCATSVAAFDDAMTALAALAKNTKAQYVRIEPVAAGLGAGGARLLAERGAVKAPSDVQPALTWKVDLTQDQAALLKGMRSTSRNLFRNIHKKGVTFDISTDPADLPILLTFLAQVSGRAEFKAQSNKYLSTAAQVLMPAGAAKLFIARLDGEPIAAALSYDTPETRVYAHAAADDNHRKLNAGIPLLVTMMLDAKASGMSEFDMWGVSPEDAPGHPWAGFSRFKRSFGGAEVSYLGTWDLPINKFMYNAYGATRQVRGLARRALKSTKAAAAGLRKRVPQQGA